MIVKVLLPLVNVLVVLAMVGGIYGLRPVCLIWKSPYLIPIIIAIKKKTMTNDAELSIHLNLRSSRSEP